MYPPPPCLYDFEVSWFLLQRRSFVDSSNPPPGPPNLTLLKNCISQWTTYFLFCPLCIVEFWRCQLLCYINMKNFVRNCDTCRLGFFSYFSFLFFQLPPFSFENLHYLEKKYLVMYCNNKKLLEFLKNEKTCEKRKKERKKVDVLTTPWASSSILEPYILNRECIRSMCVVDK